MQTTCEKSWSAFCYPLLAYYFNIKILKTKDLEFSNFEPRSNFFRQAHLSTNLTHFLGGEGGGRCNIRWAGRCIPYGDVFTSREVITLSIKACEILVRKQTIKKWS